jgi:Tfp pilus assembly protein PilO
MVECFDGRKGNKMAEKRMMSYVSAVVAVGIALLVSLGAGLWFHAKTTKLQSLQKQAQEIHAEKQKLQQVAALTENWKKRRDLLHLKIQDLTQRCAEKNNEGAQLVAVVVKASSAAGLKMTGTSECPTPSQTPDSAEIRTVSYKFQLAGPYAGLVKFFQGMPEWLLSCKIQSVNIAPVAKGEKDAEISAELILSVFSIRI